MTTSELERMMAQVNFKINNHFQKHSLTKKKCFEDKTARQNEARARETALLQSIIGPQLLEGFDY